MTELIKVYKHEGEGYNPFIIQKEWQVAQLNYLPEQDLMNIKKMDKHLETDEVFILTRGNAILIAAEGNGTDFSFQCVSMVPGVTYNIPATVWHNIAMNKDAEVIIIEKSNTHLHDFVYQPLNEDEMERLNSQLQSLIGK